MAGPLLLLLCGVLALLVLHAAVCMYLVVMCVVGPGGFSSPGGGLYFIGRHADIAAEV